jgi:hypothetical protein
MAMGRGFPISVTTKQKLNTKSLNESEFEEEQYWW